MLRFFFFLNLLNIAVVAIGAGVFPPNVYVVV